MRLQGSQDVHAFAKRLRRAMTPPEIALWLALRRNESGLRFRRQHAAGTYILDFYCARAKLAVEVDGGAHGFGDRPVRDAARDVWLTMQGIEVARYAAAEVLKNLDGVVTDVIGRARARQVSDRVGRGPPPPSPSAPPPPGGGGFGA